MEGKASVDNRRKLGKNWHSQILPRSPLNGAKANHTFILKTAQKFSKPGRALFNV